MEKLAHETSAHYMGRASFANGHTLSQNPFILGNSNSDREGWNKGWWSGKLKTKKVKDKSAFYVTAHVVKDIKFLLEKIDLCYRTFQHNSSFLEGEKDDSKSLKKINLIKEKYNL